MSSAKGQHVQADVHAGAQGTIHADQSQDMCVVFYNLFKAQTRQAEHSPNLPRFAISCA
jgi:hypothetical protein